MNQKKDIIDAWIAVEQFSEGDIKSNDRKYRKIDFEKVSRLNTDKDSVSETKRDILDWKSYFLQEMDAFLEREKISEKNRDEAGIILYFGIFKFEEVIKIIREKYKIKDTGEELKSGEKFTLSLSFDKDLNLVQDKLF